MRIDDVYTLKEELTNYFLSAEEWTRDEASKMIVAIEIFVAQFNKDEFNFDYIEELKKEHLRDVNNKGVRFRAINSFCEDLKAFSDNYDLEKGLFEESNA